MLGSQISPVKTWWRRSFVCLSQKHVRFISQNTVITPPSHTALCVARWQNRSPLTAFRIILDPGLIFHINEKCLSRIVCRGTHIIKKIDNIISVHVVLLFDIHPQSHSVITNPCVVCSYSWSVTCSALTATFSAVSDPSNHPQLSLEYTLDQLPPLPPPLDFSGSNNRFIWSILHHVPGCGKSSSSRSACSGFVHDRWKSEKGTLPSNCCSVAPEPPLWLERGNDWGDLWDDIIVAALLKLYVASLRGMKRLVFQLQKPRRFHRPADVPFVNCPLCGTWDLQLFIQPFWQRAA